MERIENNWKELKRIVRTNGNKLNRIERIVKKMEKWKKMKRIEKNWKELERIGKKRKEFLKSKYI